MEKRDKEETVRGYIEDERETEDRSGGYRARREGETE